MKEVFDKAYLNDAEFFEGWLKENKQKIDEVFYEQGWLAWNPAKLLWNANNVFAGGLIASGVYSVLTNLVPNGLLRLPSFQAFIPRSVSSPYEQGMSFLGASNWFWNTPKVTANRLMGVASPATYSVVPYPVANSFLPRLPSFRALSPRAKSMLWGAAVALPVGYFILKLGEKSLYPATLPQTGSTLLHFAAAGNAMDVARLLIEHGADVKIKDAEGRNFIDVAMKCGYSQFAADCKTLIGKREGNLSQQNKVLEIVLAALKPLAHSPQNEELKSEASIAAPATAGPQFPYGFEELCCDYVPGDCLFNAVSHSKKKKDTSELRKKMVAEMKAHPERYKDSLTQNGVIYIGDGSQVIPYSGWEDYVNKISQPKTWADNPEVAALSHALRRPIIVLRAGEIPPQSDPIHGKEFLQGDRPPIFIGYVNKNHYIPLKFPGGKRPRDIITAISADLEHLKSLVRLPVSAASSVVQRHLGGEDIIGTRHNFFTSASSLLKQSEANSDLLLRCLRQ